MKLNCDRRTAMALQAVLTTADNADLADLKAQVDKIVARPPDADTFLTVSDMEALLDVIGQALPPVTHGPATPNERQVRESAVPKLRRKVEQIRAMDRARGDRAPAPAPEPRPRARRVPGWR